VTPAHPLRGRGLRRRLAAAFEGAPDLPVDPDLDPAAPGPDHHRAVVPVHRRHPVALLAVAAGGFLGALARYELQRTWSVTAGTFPSSTFVINTSGSFLLGLLLAFLSRARSPRWRFVRLFAGVGLLGAWTTMSTVAVEADTLVRAGDAALAVVYLLASVAAGVVAAAVGAVLGRPRSAPSSGALAR
jgi:CrcB protein